MIKYAITDLIDIETLQQLKDEFEKYTGLDAIVTDEFAKPITRGNTFDRVRKLILEPSDDERNPYEIQDRYYSALLHGESISFKQHNNIFYVISPIMVEGGFLGLFICGTSEKEDAEECTPEKIERGAQFLSTIASVLSRIAYENYLSLSNSEAMQQTSKNQTEAIAETAHKLKKSMKEWTSVINEALESDNLEIIKEKLKDVLLKGNELYNIVDYSVKEIRDKTESISLLETEYNLRHLVPQEMERVKRIAAKKMVAMSYTIDGSVPQLLFGDTDRIMQIIYILFKDSVERIQSGRLNMEFSCVNSAYGKMLTIRYIDLVQGLEDADIEAVQMFIATGDETYIKKASPLLYDYKTVNRLIRQLYGAIDFNVLSETQIEFVVRIPQLEIEVEELGS